jgi:purine-nucleoside phosphorylase
MSLFPQHIQEAAAFLQAHSPFDSLQGIVILGSGLGDFADTLRDPVRVAYGKIPHFSPVTVSGHAGQLVFGEAASGLKVACLQGRFHYYEGHEPTAMVFPLRVLAQLGAQFLIVTNAAGGIRPGLQAGQPMLISDHLNLMGMNPLRGPHDESFGPRFVDMNQAYDPVYRQLAQAVAAEQGLALPEGIYAAVSGANYETPAEVRMLAILGADAVGMSTVPEVIVARQLGLRVIGLSLIANAAAGLTGDILKHEDVLSVAQEGANRFKRLLQGILLRLAANFANEG